MHVFTAYPIWCDIFWAWDSEIDYNIKDGIGRRSLHAQMLDAHCNTHWNNTSQVTCQKMRNHRKCRTQTILHLSVMSREKQFIKDEPHQSEWFMTVSRIFLTLSEESGRWSYSFQYCVSQKCIKKNEVNCFIVMIQKFWKHSWTSLNQGEQETLSSKDIEIVHAAPGALPRHLTDVETAWKMTWVIKMACPRISQLDNEQLSLDDEIRETHGQFALGVPC